MSYPSVEGSRPRLIRLPTSPVSASPPAALLELPQHEYRLERRRKIIRASYEAVEDERSTLALPTSPFPAPAVVYFT
jgi:hypothetical protein